MTKQQLVQEVFEALRARLSPPGSETRVFVGLQGDNRIVVMQRGGEHFAVEVHPAAIEVAG